MGGAQGLLQEHFPLVQVAATLLCSHHTDVSHFSMHQGKEEVIEGWREVLHSVEGEGEDGRDLSQEVHHHTSLTLVATAVPTQDMHFLFTFDAQGTARCYMPWRPAVTTHIQPHACCKCT